jgi:hypothetical protein
LLRLPSYRSQDDLGCLICSSIAHLLPRRKPAIRRPFTENVGERLGKPARINVRTTNCNLA